MSISWQDDDEFDDEDEELPWPEESDMPGPEPVRGWDAAFEIVIDFGTCYHIAHPEDALREIELGFQEVELRGAREGGCS